MQYSISSDEYFFNCKHRRWFLNYLLILKGTYAIITELACEFHPVINAKTQACIKSTGNQAKNARKTA